MLCSACAVIFTRRREGSRSWCQMRMIAENEGADALLQHLAPLLGALYLDFEGLEEGQIAESEQLLGDFHLSIQ